MKAQCQDLPGNDQVVVEQPQLPVQPLSPVTKWFPAVTAHVTRDHDWRPESWAEDSSDLHARQVGPHVFPSHHCTGNMLITLR
jgi:hypothetical protein